MTQGQATKIIAGTSLGDSVSPSADQRRTSTPSRHVWVRASAGSGKTKVLVDRLLRLLLPDTDTGAPGIQPEKILCLTFTKAGAAEMSLRLQKRLLEWSAADDKTLQENLKELIGADPSETLQSEARRLFARVLDAPSKLRVLTIHSFCQSILGRFPIETGLSPDFKVVEEAEAADYLKKSLSDSLLYAAAHPGSDIGQVFTRLAIVKNLEQLQASINEVIREPIKLQDFFIGLKSLGDVQGKLAAGFGITELGAFSDHGFCDDAHIPRQTIRAIADIFSSSTDSDVKSAGIINDWLSAGIRERLDTLDLYKKAVLSKGRGAAAKNHPDLPGLQALERARIERCALANNIRATADLLFLSFHILERYERHKQMLGVLDYGDLIFRTKRLLAGQFRKESQSSDFSAAWVLYKLDEGIDHILVDESQDTNPDQWDIVRRLSREFFSGEAKPTDRPRTLFVVGDEKQSIFSFQRADPAEFHRMREYFDEKVGPLQEGFEESLIFSFRSTAPVLKLVDAVFEDPALLQHIGLRHDEPLRHISYRTDSKKEKQGAVELWAPVIEEKAAAAQPGWQLPFSNQQSTRTAIQRLAAQIAARIGAMIEKREARPGDFLILMRSRSPLMLQIIRELKLRNLPVSGLDRLVLSESLIVQDLLAICDFVLLPGNDFALAALLKSPFIGLSEDALMDLAINRGETQSLWSALQASRRNIADWLSALIAFSNTVQPYEFLDYVLTRPCPADPQGSGYRACARRLGADALDPLDEILGEALKIELQDIRTLQDFVFYQKGRTREIKREMEEGAAHIRIMTVHASKGLEAPIVILPDTMSVPRKDKVDQFLWPDKSLLPAPLWCAEGKDARSQTYGEALGRLGLLQIEEYSRLLYVALTRARDRLIVCGALKGENPNTNSWYALVSAGFDRLPDVKAADNGDRIYRLVPDAPKTESVIQAPAAEIPGWLSRPAPSEPDMPGSFTPSSEGQKPEPSYSPLDQSRHLRFRRGLATHKLLEILPELPDARRELAAKAYVARPALGLPQDLQASIVDETLKVLNDPVFAPVFGPQSLAEVPVTGEMPDGRVINGQIDRLVITETEILIVDFKTNRPSPADVSDIPLIYKAQLAAYAAALRAIYPERLVKCALLWTDQSLLMPVKIDGTF